MRIFQRQVPHRKDGWERRNVRGDGKVTMTNDRKQTATVPLKPGVDDEQYIARLLREGWKEVK